MSILAEIRNVTQRYGGVAALDHVSLDIPDAGYTVLLGPSGSGKTTLLNILGGFVTPTEGTVLIGGEDVTHMPPARRPTTTVFQDYALFPHMSVGANVGFGLRMRGIDRAARDARARAMLELVGLATMFERKPHQLSGGQRQRVALARALAVEPKLLLLDEPLGALDLKLRRQMQDELKAIQKRVGTTFVHVTHDQEEAMALGDLVVVMNHGRIEDQGAPNRVYLRPATRFAAGFMGASNFLEGAIAEATAERLSIDTEIGRLQLPSRAGVSAGQKVTLSMRPEHLSTLVDDVSIGAIAITDMTFAGTHLVIHGQHERAPHFRPFLHAPQDCGHRIGDTARLGIEADKITIFAADSGRAV